MEKIAADEIIELFGKSAIDNLKISKEGVRFKFTGELERVLKLRTVVAVYMLRYFDVPRPKALLGHQNFELLLQDIERVIGLSADVQFQTLFVSAAGSESSVMLRLKEEIARRAKLEIGDSTGDLWLRIRRVQSGWEVLTRLTPRPLVTRGWRVCNMEGALNAAVANAMIRLVSPQPNDVVVNMMCGTGTLMIECSQTHLTAFNIGCDIETSALDCAQHNLEAAQLQNKISLIHADARTLPFPEGIADIICADLPFGQLVGSHEQNQLLYPKFLSEAWRLGHSGTRCIFITHEVRLIETLLAQSNQWRLEQTYKVTLRGLHPRIYLLLKP